MTPFLEKFTAAMLEAEPGDPTAEDAVARAAVVDHGRRPAAGAARARRRRRRQARGRRRALGQLLPADGADRHHARQRGVRRRSCSDRSRRCTRSGPRRRRSSSPTTRPSGSAPTCSPPTREQAVRVADKIEAGMVFVNARRRRRRRAAVRRRQALRLRPRARPVRRGRVRQQEADPHRLSTPRRAASMSGAARRAAATLEVQGMPATCRAS